MATNRSEKYDRMNYILVDCGIKLTRGVLLKVIQEMSPQDHEPYPWTIDHFLLANKDKLISSKLTSSKRGKQMDRILFPGFAIKTDILRWDLSLLCYVVSKTSETDDNMKAVRHDIECLRSTRNKLAHVRDNFISDEEYETYLDRIKGAVKRCLEYVKDEALTQEINQNISDVEKGEHRKVEYDVNGLLQDWYEADEEIRARLTQLSNEHTKMMQLLQQILDRLPPGSVPMPVTDIYPRVANCTPTVERPVSDMLVDAFNDVIHNETNLHVDLSEEILNDIRKAIKKAFSILTSDGISVCGAERGSIRLKIKCQSFRCWRNLIDDYVQKKLEKSFSDLETVVRTLKGCENAALDVIIFEDTFWSYTNDLANAIVNFVKDSSLVVKRSIEPEDSLSLHLMLTSTIPGQYIKVTDAVSNGSETEFIQDIAHDLLEHVKRKQYTSRAEMIESSLKADTLPAEHAYSNPSQPPDPTLYRTTKPSIIHDKSFRQSLKVFQEPRCLIETDKDGHLVIIKDTIEELMKIDLTLNVVAITGLYRTGKSYLMNRLANRTSGFALGTTIQSKTKGIWVLCEIHPLQKDQVLVLLDTEGLCDALKGDIDHDIKMFLLATLLSSTLVYNVMTAFNQEAVEKLTFITEISKNLMISTKDKTDENFDLLMPEFVLCIRDFTLELRIDGKEISEDEYLEHCLKEKRVESYEDERYNRPRQCIKKYFTTRKAFTFDRPASRKMMMILDKVRDEDLSPEFIMDTAKFKSYIYERPPKTLQNKRPVTGSMFAELITVYVNAVRAGEVPCIDDAVTVMSKAENEKRAKAAIENYIEELQKIKIPVPNNGILLVKCIEYQTSILSRLNSELLFDDDNKVESSTKAEMEQLYQKLEDKNSKLLYEKCLGVLKKLYEEEVKDKVNSKKYMVVGGYEMYKRDMTGLLENYTDQLTRENVDPMEIQKAKKDFMAHKTSESEEIMAADMNISVNEKEEEMETRKKEMKQELEEIRKREKARYDAELKRQNKLHREEMENIRKVHEELDMASTKAYLDERLAKRDLLKQVSRLQKDLKEEKKRCSIM